MAKGLDIGTGGVVGAIMKDDEYIFNRVRNMYVELDRNPLVLSMLKKAGVPYVQMNGKIYALGEEAMQLAKAFNQSPKRPMAKGVLNPHDPNATPIMLAIIKQVLGDPAEPNELLYFSVPANPVDAEFNAVYHEAVFKKMLTELGYRPVALREGLCVIYSELLDENLTGIGISCLLPGQEVFCNGGVKDIEDIEEGDLVLSKNGSWNQVYKTTRTGRSELIYKLKIAGRELCLTGDHLVDVLEGGSWKWKRVDSLKKDDVVGEPVINHNQKRNFISFKDRIGNGKQFNKTFEMSYNLGKFLGYFLGDGHIDTRETSVILDLGPNEQDLVEDYKMSCSVFDREISQISRGNRNNIRLTMGYAGLSRWLLNHCYHSGNKVVPFKVESLSLPVLTGIVNGLLNSDGCFGQETISFSNTSSDLSVFLHQALGILGISSRFKSRKPRNDGLIRGRQISGKKTVYEVVVTGSNKRMLQSLLDSPIGSELHKRIGGYRLNKIKSVKQEEYTGWVYDLSVENDPSFSLPGVCVHNCGAGMMNVSGAVFGKEMPKLSFSIAASGDYIDENVARAVNVSVLKAMSAKETTDLLNPKDNVQEAVVHYYTHLIGYVLDQIAAAWNGMEEKPEIDTPVIAIAGGTAIPKGFKELFQKIAATREISFLTGNKIVMADDPLNTIAKGALFAAINESE
jgi:intein/homing endonuclease